MINVTDCRLNVMHCRGAEQKKARVARAFLLTNRLLPGQPVINNLDFVADSVGRSRIESECA